MTKQEQQKHIEHIYISKYMERYHNVVPQYIEPLIDIPDGYFKVKEEYWAVEAVSYFMDEKEQNTVAVKNTLKEINKRENNIFEQVHKHFGKKEFPHGIIIRYGNKQQIIKDILKGAEYILSIFHGNKFWSKKYNDSYPLKNFLSETIKNNVILNVTLDKRQKENINLRLHYSTIFNKREISETYIWWENKNTYIKSIIDIMQNKIDRYDEYVNRMREANQKFDKYSLLVYPQRIPIEVEEEELKKAIEENFAHIKYDEVAIQLFKKLILISNA